MTDPAFASAASVVEIEFNRDFTWSEREEFRNVFSPVEDTMDVHNWLNKRRVRIFSGADSRETVDIVSEFVSVKYLNVHPVVAKTLKPRVRV